MSKMMRRGIFMFVLLFAVSLGIIYYTIDLEALKTISTFNGESLLLAIIALALGMYFDGLRLQRLVKIGGYHVLAGKGSTEFGIASATTELIRAVFHDEKKVLPCSCYLDGQYGEAGIFASTPAVIGKDGIEDILELQITEEELTLFKASCSIIREHATKAESM